jgi:site-specific DNA recombinase
MSANSPTGLSARRAPAPPPPRVVRCAIYTRKSTEEGLDQDFNSLDAQREACEAYVASQRHEGWMALPEKYNDGGFTGANMDRPGLERLIADIEAGRVDTVLVYKVDRLSRSLMDFSRLIGLFDQHNVSFVSVTQQFNTSNSMGRLTLNILLSFAQFEREMIAERTRDKMSAARRKGKFVGGMQFLGYDLDANAKKLVVNEAEAAIVRELFRLYLQRRSIIATVKEANSRGWTMKSWVTKPGHRRVGGPFNKSRLYALLTNIAYIGKIDFKGEIYAAEHPPIVDDLTFERVQSLLRENSQTGGRVVRNKHGALLKGIIQCKCCDTPMIHNHTQRGSRLYRYYVCMQAQKTGYSTCPTKAVSATEIERFVVDQVREIGRNPELQNETLRQLMATREARQPDLEGERQRLQAELLSRQAEAKRLLAAVGEGRRDGTMVGSRLTELDAEIATLERRITTVRQELLTLEAEHVEADDLRTALAMFDPVRDHLTPQEQARVTQLLIESVAYDGPAGTVAITFRPLGIRTLAAERPAGAPR